MNIQALHELIANDYINVQKHPNADLYIYNYSAKAQYDRVWNEWTLACRGLIMNADYEVVARPFKKFFNWGEVENQAIPQESFEIYEKMDGSLGILYWIDEIPYIATRGSFNSDQAKVATEMLHTKYATSIPLLDKTKTYLFEIIYPENRIVVDYGKTRALILLAVIDTKTGDECPLEQIGFEVVKLYDGINDLYHLKKLEETNREGYVIKFAGGLRLKVKFDEYQRVHQIITRVSNISIWEHLKEGNNLVGILDRVPDEFYDWVKLTEQQLFDDFKAIEAKAMEEFKVYDIRKDTALYYQTCSYPAVLFKMMENRPYNQIIWKMIRPKFKKPFATHIET
ncbi:RNA ligase [Emticicia fontis]